LVKGIAQLDAATEGAVFALQTTTEVHGRHAREVYAIVVVPAAHIVAHELQREALVLVLEQVGLDLGLPAMDGLSVLKRLREWSEVPVLILSVRDEEALKVEALEAGADDYVTKPFGTAELLARLAVIQRRRFTRQNPEITAGNLTLNLLHHEASLAGDRLKLTPTEFSLLHTLAEHAGRIVTFGQIIRRVWPAQLSDQSEALRVHISHLRRKLGTSGPQIINEPAIGYRLIDS
jgi:two-component system KDP operon response regulator KdpE